MDLPILQCRYVPSIYVDAYAGYRANERPRQFTLDEEVYEIASIEDQWRSPEAMFLTF